jgi:hypothetical protein
MPCLFTYFANHFISVPWPGWSIMEAGNGRYDRLPVLQHPKHLLEPELASIEEARTILMEVCDLLENAGNRNPSDRLVPIWLMPGGPDGRALCMRILQSAAEFTLLDN